MNAIIKLLPSSPLPGWLPRRSRPSAAKRSARQPQAIMLDGVLDISKEARDAIAAEEQQRAMLPFEIAFPPESPTHSESHSASLCSPTEKSSVKPTSSPISPHPPSRLPHSAASAPAPPTPEPETALRNVPASGLGRRRNFRGHRLNTIPIPPMPTTPPPTPPTPRTPSSLNHSRSLRRQPRYTDLNTASPISRCRTFPLSRERKSTPSPSPSPSLRNSQGSIVRKSTESDARDEESRHTSTNTSTSTTPPGSPTAFAFPLPSRTTFTKRTSVPFVPPNSATRETFPREAGVEPLSIVKRFSVSGATAHSVPASPSTLEPVMDELFSSLDDVYAEYHDGAPEGVSLASMDLVSISLSSDSAHSARSAADDLDAHEEKEEEDIIADLDGGVGWRTTYSLEDEYEYTVYPESFFAPTFFSPMATLCPALHLASGESRTRPCPYSFLAEQTQALGRYHVQGSRSLPDLA
ncbi:hypothetical protein MVEN_02239800 [Mycena venus]|uniref:Uncharacterized protein n=1 Tax=Mycena venus TaxID=2733690 RepID=A0A8H6X787_9AGAR|nr:hypothetical protein MVEN_02239800 [Mycena venus]